VKHPEIKLKQKKPETVLDLFQLKWHIFQRANECETKLFQAVSVL